jgi:predicted small secreted protein
MFWFFKRKVCIESIKEDTKKGFEFVKKDISALTGWIKHLDSEKNITKRDVEEIKQDLFSIKNEIENIKNVISITQNVNSNHLFKTPKKNPDKQTTVYTVQTGVQTGVQTPNFDIFSVTERAILWIQI